jgi:hypothetical protein
MRKSGIRTPTSAPQGNPPRSSRLRDPHAEPAEPAAKNALRRVKKAHFLEPYRLSETGRIALLECLSDHAVGDPESRDLFAAAVEYAIARSRAAVKAPPAPRDGDQSIAQTPATAAETATAPPTTSPAKTPEGSMSALADSARLLARLLNDLDEPAREAMAEQLRATDPFDRAHDQAYLDAVRREVERIAEAASAVPETAPAPTPAPAEPEPSASPLEEPARRLILRIADAYEACFETKPSASAGSAFLQVIRLIAEQAAIEIPADDTEVITLLQGR